MYKMLALNLSNQSNKKGNVMVTIFLEHIEARIGFDQVVWRDTRQDNAEFVEADPVEHADTLALLRRLALMDYNERDGRAYAGDVALYADEFIDTHDSEGNVIEGGRPSGLHFPLKAPLAPVRATHIMLGTMDGKSMCIVNRWDDPLDNVMTTTEAEAAYDLAQGTVKKAAQRGVIPARKKGGAWIVRTIDVKRHYRLD